MEPRIPGVIKGATQLPVVASTIEEHFQPKRKYDYYAESPGIEKTLVKLGPKDSITMILVYVAEARITTEHAYSLLRPYLRRYIGGQ